MENHKKISHRMSEVELQLYSVVYDFIHIDRKIEDRSVRKLYRLIDNLEREFNIAVNNPKLGKDTAEIFDNLTKTLGRVLSVAQKRDRYDNRYGIYSTLHSFKEFIFFTSAVNLGVFTYLLKIEKGGWLIPLGVIGLLLYFINDIAELLRRIRKTFSKSTPNRIDINRTLEMLESKDHENIESEIERMEEILLSSDPGQVLSLNSMIKLKYYYFHNIKKGIIHSIRNNEKINEQSKLLYAQLNRFLENICQILSLSLFSVDANRPILKKRSFIMNLFNLKSAIKFIGYIMLNAISFNLFFTYLKDDLLLLFIANILFGSILMYIYYRFEVYTVKALERPIN